MRCILILGANEDEHIQVVHRALLERGARTRLIDFSQEFVWLQISNAWSLNNYDFGSSSFSVCWNRYKRAETPATHTPELQEAYVSAVEWLGFHQNVVQVLSMLDVPFVNDLRATQVYGAKLPQLRAAGELGIRFPETLISNDKRQLLAFMEEYPECIIKPLKIRRILNAEDHPSSLMFMTQSLSRGEIEACDEDAVYRTPLFVQERIQKQHEYRVVVVHNDIFCFRIDSQTHSETALDWRTQEHRDIYAYIKTPPDVRAACRKLQERFGLLTGVYDFARDSNNSLVFFECNPSGQWLIPSEKCGVDIAGSFADLLIEQAGLH